MARVDMSKAKQKAQEEADRAAARASYSGSLIYWKPKQGKNKIRVLPPWTDDENSPNANQFWREVYVHFGVGENEMTFSCPAKTPDGPGGDCPICDEVQRLRATKDPGDAEAAKQIYGKQRVYSNIVDLDDPVYTKEDVKEWAKNEFNQGKDCPFKPGDTKVQVFGYGPMIFKQLLDIFTENVDITDLESGYDISITRTGKDRQTDYNVQIVPPAKPFNLQGTDDVDAVLLDLDAKVLPFQPVSDMYAALTGAPPPPQVGGSEEPAPALPPAEEEEDHSLPEEAEAADEDAVAQDDEPAPECFKDKDTFSESDAECAGGVKEIDGENMEFEPCPYFGPCQAAVNEVLKPPKAKTRRAAKTTGKNSKKTKKSEAKKSETQEIDDLEAEMKKAIS